MADASRLLRAYLIVGPDELKRKETLARLKRYVDDDLSAFNLEEMVAGPSLTAQDLLASLTQFAMGSDVRLVIVEQAEKLPKAVSETVISYLENPNPTCTLALVADSLAKTTRLYKAVAKQGDKAIITCEKIGLQSLPSHVMRIAKARGASIALDAAEELISRVGDSTTMLETQLVTLAAIANGVPITRNLVETHVARTAEVKPWDFLNAYSNRDLKRAMKLYRIMNSESDLGLLRLLRIRLREIMCANSLAHRGQSGQLAAALADYDNISVKTNKGAKPRAPKQAWQLKNHARWARKWSEGDIIHALHECALCEKALKSSSNKEGVFVKFLLESM